MNSIRRKKFFTRRDFWGWCVMLPSIALFAFFVWVPFLRNFEFAFSKTTALFGTEGFNGFENFKAVFKHVAFIRALLNTLQYTGYSILIGFFIPIIFGIILSEVVHLRGFFRVCIYMPSIISGLAVSILWALMYDATETGFFNAFLALFGLGPFDYLGRKASVIPMIVIAMTWRGAGATVLIYLSSMQTVDSQQYEAARIDGAGAWQRLWHVTLPHLAGMIRILFIMQLISVFQVFNEPLVMTNGGGPAYASASLLWLSYDFGYVDKQPGMASAVGLFTAVIIMAFTAVYLYLTRPESARKEKREAGI